MVFDDEIVQAICTYMNSDPTESNLVIVQGITGDRGVTSAELVFFDGEGADFRVHGPAGSVRDLRIPWSRSISERPEVRQELFALLDKATDAFGSK